MGHNAIFARGSSPQSQLAGESPGGLLTGSVSYERRSLECMVLFLPAVQEGCDSYWFSVVKYGNILYTVGVV